MSRIRANQITNQSADGAPTVQNGLVISGVTTSTTFSGSGASLTNIPAGNLTGTLPAINGANLTGITQTTINNNADNRIITGSGTANTLEGEANLTFDGSSLGVKRSGSGDVAVNIECGNTISQSRILFRDSSDIDGIITYDHNDRKLFLGAGTNNATDGDIIIDSAGRVLIGTTTEGNTNADDLTIANSGEGGITIRSGSSSNGNIFFSDATSGAGEYAGIIDYKHGSNVMTFGTSGAERLRINNDGSYYFLGDSCNNTRLRLLSDGVITGSSGANDVSLEFASGQSNNLASEGAQIRYDNSNGKLHISTTYNSSDSDIRFYTRTGAIDSESNLRMNIMGDGYVMKPSQPSFAVYRNQDGYNLNNEVFPFNTARYNIGGHFNTSNYRFTAPVAGR